MEQLTKQQALDLYETGFWEKMTYFEKAKFQLFQQRLCMPFEVFHKAVEKSLKRPVFTHEFGLNVDGLKSELLGEKSPPTLAEILDLIPKDKRIIVLEKQSKDKKCFK